MKRHERDILFGKTKKERTFNPEDHYYAPTTRDPIMQQRVDDMMVGAQLDGGKSLWDNFLGHMKQSFEYGLKYNPEVQGISYLLDRDQDNAVTQYLKDAGIEEEMVTPDKLKSEFGIDSKESMPLRRAENIRHYREEAERVEREWSDVAKYSLNPVSWVPATVHTLGMLVGAAASPLTIIAPLKVAPVFANVLRGVTRLGQGRKQLAALQAVHNVEKARRASKTASAAANVARTADKTVTARALGLVAAEVGIEAGLQYGVGKIHAARGHKYDYTTAALAGGALAGIFGAAGRIMLGKGPIKQRLAQPLLKEAEKTPAERLLARRQVVEDTKAAVNKSMPKAADIPEGAAGATAKKMEQTKKVVNEALDDYNRGSSPDKVVKKLNTGLARIGATKQMRKAALETFEPKAKAAEAPAPKADKTGAKVRELQLEATDLKAKVDAAKMAAEPTRTVELQNQLAAKRWEIVETKVQGAARANTMKEALESVDPLDLVSFLRKANAPEHVRGPGEALAYATARFGQPFTDHMAPIVHMLAESGNDAEIHKIWRHFSSKEALEEFIQNNRMDRGRTILDEEMVERLMPLDRDSMAAITRGKPAPKDPIKAGQVDGAAPAKAEPKNILQEATTSKFPDVQAIGRAEQTFKKLADDFDLCMSKVKGS